MKILKKVNIKNLKKTSIIFLVFLFTLYLWTFTYSYLFEKEKITIDNYNFKQFEKIKIFLKDKRKGTFKFDDLKNFNEKYKLEIKPIKNCYYLSSYNWDEKFLFWFQIESLFYKIIHFWKNYAYPKYDIPSKRICTGMVVDWTVGECYNDNRYNHFKAVISNPCKY